MFWSNNEQFWLSGNYYSLLVAKEVVMADISWNNWKHLDHVKSYTYTNDL